MGVLTFRSDSGYEGCHSGALWVNFKLPVCWHHTAHECSCTPHPSNYGSCDWGRIHDLGTSSQMPKPLGHCSERLWVTVTVFRVKVWAVLTCASLTRTSVVTLDMSHSVCMCFFDEQTEFLLLKDKNKNIWWLGKCDPVHEGRGTWCPYALLHLC